MNWPDAAELGAVDWLLGAGIAGWVAAGAELDGAVLV
jgi:hypothetical protein